VGGWGGGEQLPLRGGEGVSVSPSEGVGG
jgi:hypothetical protein